MACACPESEFVTKPSQQTSPIRTMMLRPRQTRLVRFIFERDVMPLIEAPPTAG